MTTTTTQPPHPESPVERALVARGWGDIDRVERMGPVDTGRVEVAALGAARDRAHRWYSPPVTDTVPDHAVAMYQSESGLVRYRRVADFLTKGERVFEVGIGMGFLATMMLGEGLGRYRGVDLVEHNVARTRQVLGANGYSDIADAQRQDLYELTRADVEAVDATLLVCCEVIEHVPDPEAALATLAGALPAGADLLFSVPLLGRLEGIWGHGQAFGGARIHRMLERAGLVAHHVEPLHNIWALVLASRGPQPSPRAAAVLETAPPFEPHRFVEAPFETMANRPVTELPRLESRRTRRVRDHTIREEADPESLHGPRALHVGAIADRITSGPGKGWSSYAGVGFAVPEGTKGARVEVELADPDQVEAFYVEFRTSAGRIGLWQWKPGERRPRRSRPTFVVTPQRTGTYLRRAPGSTIEGADAAEVYVRAKDDHPIDFHLRRWAWIS